VKKYQDESIVNLLCKDFLKKVFGDMMEWQSWETQNLLPQGVPVQVRVSLPIKSMIEYPSIINSSKAPQEPCVAFYKLDGSNVRVKYTRNKGFSLFGSRHQLFDETHPFLAGAIPSFNERYSEFLNSLFATKQFKDFKEIIVFGEYLGEKSFAGIHDENDKTKKFVLFDVMPIYKDRVEFLKPQTFLELFSGKVEIPEVVYEGNLNKEFISLVRENKASIPLEEGVICKGLQTKGSFKGKVWMCKIKTNHYLEKLKTRFGDDWEKYSE
jgi:hypothetical protein